MPDEKPVIDDAEKTRALSEWLVIRSQHGDRKALEALIQLWQERYFLYSMRRLGDRDAARDVTQNALLSICRSVKQLKDPGTYPSWSYRIVERRCTDWLRKTLRERKTIEHNNASLDQAIDESTNVSDENDHTDARISIRKLLENLDPMIRSLLQLYYLEELSVSEISDILKVPKGTVKSRLFYARKLLASKIDENLKGN